jgi:hypothetical protein
MEKDIEIGTVKLMTIEKSSIEELVRSIPDAQEAISVSVRMSKKQHKQFYSELDYDDSLWSRILKGKAHFDLNKIGHFTEIAGNPILLAKLAYDCGYELRVIPKTLEDQLRQRDERIKELETALKVLQEIKQPTEEK